MKLMRNTRTGKMVVFDKSLLTLGYYEIVDDAPQAESKPNQETEPLTPTVDTAADKAADMSAASTQQTQQTEIKGEKAPPVKRAPKRSGGMKDAASATDKVSINLTQGE